MSTLNVQEDNILVKTSVYEVKVEVTQFDNEWCKAISEVEEQRFLRRENSLELADRWGSPSSVHLSPSDMQLSIRWRSGDKGLCKAGLDTLPESSQSG